MHPGGGPLMGADAERPVAWARPDGGDVDVVHLVCAAQVATAVGEACAAALCGQHFALAELTLIGRDEVQPCRACMAAYSALARRRADGGAGGAGQK